MLELKRISAGYGEMTVLEGVDASFEKGKLTSIIGVNGSGKSTLLKAILGIIPLSDGEAIIDEESLSSMSRNEIAKKVAYLAQGRNIPDMTVRQMVLHGRFPYLSYPRRYKQADKDIAAAAMDAVGVTHLAEKPLAELSGGMRQNAYIAMALAQDTDYILLDEPATYLDIAHRLELSRLLRGLADAGRGIVTVTHDLPLAFDFSDEILLINNHKAEIKAPPSEICDKTIIKEVFGVEIEKKEGGGFCYRY